MDGAKHFKSVRKKTMNCECVKVTDKNQQQSISLHADKNADTGRDHFENSETGKMSGTRRRH
jgi:hypothetical protein